MTTWPAMLITETFSRTGAESPTLQALYDRLQCLIAKGIDIDFADDTSVATSYGTNYVGSFYIRIPPYLISGRKLRFKFKLKSSNASGIAYAKASQVVPAGGGVDGTEVNVPGTSYAVVESIITIPDGTWVNTIQEFRINLKTNNASYTATLSRKNITPVIRGGE